MLDFSLKCLQTQFLTILGALNASQAFVMHVTLCLFYLTYANLVIPLYTERFDQIDNCIIRDCSINAPNRLKTKAIGLSS